MGLIANLLGLGSSAGQIGGAVERVAEVFVPNKTKEIALQHAEYSAALSQFGAEFQQNPAGAFDGVVNGLNRLPRPILALGTVALFVYAMWDPAGFTTRMQGLAHVPDPLWWLLGAVVSFYFGARELHYLRDGRRVMRAMAAPVAAAPVVSQPVAAESQRKEAGEVAPDRNPALEAWRATRGARG